MTIENNIIALLSLAFGLGLLHALDADHVMAITGLSQGKQRGRQVLQFCLRWSLGHGLTLLTLGILVFFVGQNIPPALGQAAETLVAMLLIGICLFILRGLYRDRAHLHFHRHHGLPAHAHWHRHHSHEDHTDRRSHRHRHAPTMIGMLHGTAGSAPVLALIPISQLPSPGLALAYLLSFGIGIFLAMLAFGGLLAHLLGKIRQWGNRAIHLVQTVVALSSGSLGAYMLVELWA